MKISAAALLLCFGTASAGITPELSIGINTKGPDELAGVFDSTVKWSTEGKLRSVDYEAGINMKADSLGGERPFSIWGKLNRSIGGWDLRANLDTKSDDFRRVDFDVEAKGGPTDCRLRAQGNVDTASQNGSIRQVGLSQSFDAPGGSATVAPSYNLATGKADVVLAYENRDSDTTITVAADMDKQRVTISQRLDADNEIAPTITSDGDIEIAYKRTLGDGTLTANYKPNDSTSLSYEEGPWVAKVEAPMDGFYKLEGPQVSIKRSVSVDAN